MLSLSGSEKSQAVPAARSQSTHAADVSTLSMCALAYCDSGLPALAFFSPR